MNRIWKLCQTSFLYGAVGFLIYVLSFSPISLFLTGDTGSVYYRSPVIFRPVEWMIVHSPARAPLLWWAELCGAGTPTQWQAFLYAQHISDPARDLHVNVQPVD